MADFITEQTNIHQLVLKWNLARTMKKTNHAGVPQSHCKLQNIVVVISFKIELGSMLHDFFGSKPKAKMHKHCQDYGMVRGLFYVLATC
jgi:HD superfamily phosphohydrolase YqeK